MKLTAEINNAQVDVEINGAREPDELLRAKIGDRLFELSVREPEPDVYVLLSETAVYECRVARSAEIDTSGEIYEVNLKGRTYRVSLTDPKRLRANAGSRSGNRSAGAASIKAPMPGKVLRVLVAVGAPIEAGAAVVVVEAMKMQNELKAPQAGIVTELCVEIGATVNAGDVLAVIE